MHHQLYWQSWVRPDDLLALLNLPFSPLYAHCPPAEICNTAGQFWPSWLICLDTILAHKINWIHLSSIFFLCQWTRVQWTSQNQAFKHAMCGWKDSSTPFQMSAVVPLKHGQDVNDRGRTFPLRCRTADCRLTPISLTMLPPPRRTDGPNGHSRPTNHRHLSCGRSRRRRLESTSLFSYKRHKHFRCLLGKLDFKVVLVFRDGGRCSALNCSFLK